jgi:FkbM family methyltransferase
VRTLTWLERGAALLRGAGLGVLVDRLSGLVGRAAALRPTVVDGLRLTGTHAGQLYYLRELAEGRESFLVEVLTRATPRGGLAVDAGAHIGYMTLQLARAVGAEGRVLALEPEPEARRALQRNLERNGMADRVTVVPVALGARSGQAVLHVSGGGETSSLAHVPTARGSVEVDVAALDDLLPDAPRVDIVKLDVEGSEAAALEGMQDLLARSGDAPVLAVECHPGLLAAMGASQEELIGRLAALGFRCWVADEESRRLVERIEVTGDYVNLICARRPLPEAP